MKVVILGCGPAGLLAAHGASLALDGQAEITIVSIKQKSVMAGAQFIHEEIPGIDVPGFAIQLLKLGTKEGYAQKVYGDPNHPCSWDNYDRGLVPAWPMKAIYEELWDRYEDKIIDMKIDRDVLDSIEDGNADYLISSIPAPTLCRLEHHSFESSAVKIVVWPESVAGAVITYNGDPNYQEYRMSFMFGQMAMEYPIHAELRSFWTLGKKVVHVEKPQSNNCTCRDQWRRVGRYGRWQRGVLVHHAFQEVYDSLSMLQM